MKRNLSLIIMVSFIGLTLNVFAMKGGTAYGGARMEASPTDSTNTKNYAAYNADVQLNERSRLYYGSEFYPMDSTRAQLNTSYAFVVDKVNGDTTSVEMRNHRFALLSNPPLVFVDVFEVEYDGHGYVVHELYDVRTFVNSKEEKLQPTRDCYQIR